MELLTGSSETRKGSLYPVIHSFLIDTEGAPSPCCSQKCVCEVLPSKVSSIFSESNLSPAQRTSCHCPWGMGRVTEVLLTGEAAHV